MRESVFFTRKPIWPQRSGRYQPAEISRADAVARGVWELSPAGSLGGSGDALLGAKGGLLTPDSRIPGL